MHAAAMAAHLAMAIFLPCLVGMAAGTAPASGAAEGRTGVVNTQVQRKIDVSSQFAKVRTFGACLLPSIVPSLAGRALVFHSGCLLRRKADFGLFQRGV